MTKLAGEHRQISGWRLFQIVFIVSLICEMIRSEYKNDPNIAEAVMQAPADDGQEPDTVKQVFQKGYKLKDKIIRYAKVCVVK